MKIEPVFVEADVKRKQIRDRAIQSIKDAFPFDGKEFSVDVKDVKVHPAHILPRDHKKAILSARTLSEPIRGTLVLRNARGKTVQKVPNFNLLQLPYLTDHHTFVVGGNSYNVSNQLRMKPGVYTRKRRNSELDAFFNLAKGSNFHMNMDPASGQFNVKYGTSKIPLYSVLNRLGVSDAQMSKAWNQKLMASNRDAFSKNADKHVVKLYDKMVHPAEKKEGEDKIQAIKRVYADTRLDPHVTQRTLGKRFDRVTPDALLSASNKLLRAYNAEADFDERDNMAFKKLKSVDDFIGERIMLEARGLKRKVVSKLERGAKRGTLDAVPVSPFTKTVRSFLSTSALSSNPTQINPMEILDQATRITSLGEGGISDVRAVPIEAQRLHLSHAGVVDPIRTPESGRVGIDLRTSIFTGRDPEGNIYTVLRDAKTNKHKYVSVEDMVDSVVAFPKQKLTGKVDVIADEKIQSMPASKVKYVLPSTHALYSPAGNLIPFQDSTDGNRQTMASKMMTQSLPLVSSEPPLVQVEGYKWGGGRGSMERDFGRLMVPRSPMSGVVTAIRDGVVHVKPKKGKTAAEASKIPFYDNFPLASKTYLNHDLKVKVGDEVKNDQVLADSPFVKDGQLSLGTNLTTAYIPLRGMNSNDAIVVSESAAKKLTSVHMFMPGEDLDADMTANRTKHQSYFGNKYTKEVYDKLDADGIVKPGMKIRKGDLLVASIQKSKLSPEAQMLGKLHKSLVKPYQDSALTWERDHEGTVVDVLKTGRKIRMTVKVDEPLNIGDKICYTEDTEILTKDGWKPVASISMGDVCYTLNASGIIELHEPEATHTYPTAGSLYELCSQQVDQRVTDNHRLYVKLRGRDNFELIPAKDAIGKRCRHKKDGVWAASTPEFFTLPQIKSLDAGKVPTKAWLRFLGAYLANGSATVIARKDRNDAKEYRAALHTVRGVAHSVSGNQHSWLKGLLEECGFEYTERDDRLVLNSKQLVLYLLQFGHAADKHVPQQVFSWGKDAASWLLEGLLGCDVHKTLSGSLGYTTTSPQLADDVQRLALHVGWAANVTSHQPSNECWRKRYSVGIIRSKCNPQINHGHKRKQRRQSERICVSDEPVYGVTVPNGVLYIRVNGKAVWSGNSGRYGNKGIVSSIVPDDQMLQDESGNPIDVAISSSSVISRINPSQILETALGKVAQKTGKPIAIENYADRDNVKWVKSELKKHGIKDKETIFDPVTGKKIKNILVGPQYTLKLFKSTDTNYSARGVESYDVDQQPSSGGTKGAKGVGRLVFNALLAHDARNILKESAVLKSQKNDEWWRAYQLGRPLPTLKTTFAYDKFGAMLAGSGVKMDKDKDTLSLGPLTDDDVTQMSSGKVTNPLFVRAKDLRPERGGLFDPVSTGGTTGKKWSHFDLKEPVVNPIFERPVKTLLGTSSGEYDKLIREEGGKGISKRLSKIDLPKREREIREKLGNMKGTPRDNAIKELKYIRTLRRNDIRPEKAYISSKIPVVPPMFRPIIPGRRGDLQVNDANYLYRDAMLANDLLSKTKGLPDEVQHDARKHLHDAVGALYGLKDPVSPQLKARNVKGFLNRIAGTGSGPKYGFLHQKLLKRRQDVSGRATWSPDPTLGMDEVGLPEDMAWDMYRPFVTKQLVHRGYKALDARKQIDEKTPVARELLNMELRNRPALINRAPSLYRYNVLAAYPKMVPGKTLRVHEMLAPIQAGDFDGDAVQVHVPVGDAAVHEARRMTLPNMLLSDKEKFTLTKAAPQQEAVTGIYMATSAKPKGKKRIFKSKADAMAAYNRGEISLSTPVEVRK